MKKNYLHVTFVILILVFNNLKAQTIWSGPLFEFVKQNNANPALGINQDIITPSVAITRGGSGEIYNAVLETASQKASSPLGTEWAIGDLSEISNLTFSSFRSAVGKPRLAVGKKLVLHITQEDVYISVEFTSWSGGNGGSDGGEGGFSYKRSTNNVTNVGGKITEQNIAIFPNPSTNFIQIAGIEKPVNYQIYDLIGSKVSEGIISRNDKINIKNQKEGIYFLKLENGNIIRFVKK
mgnify:CR=1 FL=1